MKLHFFTENVSYRITGKRRIKKWIETVFELEGRIGGEVNIVLCDDDHLLELNRKYLNHNTLTDIITFSYHEPGEEVIAGEVYISLPRIRENSIKFKQPVARELCRVIMHGMLHLTGMDDRTKEQRLAMTRKEDSYLAIFDAE